MIIDCTTCPVRGRRCDDCAVTVLHGPSASLQLDVALQLDAAESRAVSLFVGAGLVSAGAVATLRARPERPQHRAPVRDVG